MMRRGDQRGQHHLGCAVVGGGEIRRVDRQQEDRDQLREDAGGGVGRPCRREPAQVAEHQPSGARGPALRAGGRLDLAAPRGQGDDAERQQRPGHRDRSRSPRIPACARTGPRRRPRRRRGSGCAAGQGRTRSRSANSSTAAYGISPSMPSSAATVIGSVCVTGCLHPLDLTPVGDRERARAVAGDRALAEEVDAAGRRGCRALRDGRGRLRPLSVSLGAPTTSEGQGADHAIAIAAASPAARSGTRPGRRARPRARRCSRSRR